jgi:hypothetical protein
MIGMEAKTYWSEKLFIAVELGALGESAAR